MAYSIKSDINTGGDASYSAGTPESKWQLNGHIKEFITLTVTLESSNGTSKTVSDNRITAKHVVLNNITEEKIGYIVEPN